MVGGHRCTGRRPHNAAPAQVVLAAALLGAAALSAALVRPAAAAPGPGTPPPQPAGLARPTAPELQTDPARAAEPARAGDLALPAHPGAGDLLRIQSLVAGLTVRAAAAEHAVDGAVARQAYLAVALGEARDAETATAGRLDAAVRTAYESARSSPTLSLLAGVPPADAEAERHAQDSVLHVDGALVLAHRQASGRVAALAAGSDDAHRTLVAMAMPVEAADEQANAVLDAATTAFAADQAALATLRAQRATLAAASERLALEVTPAVSATGDEAAVAAAQAPILALLERTPVSALPAGFHDSGKRVSGISSYYGPGFVGARTSSGSPFDPNQLTAAMLAVPLGTLVHVVTASGGAVNVLVTDHGPYAGVDRVIDLSERAAAIAGVGLSPVSVEVLEPD